MRRSARAVAVLAVAMMAIGCASTPSPGPTNSPAPSLPELSGWQRIDLPPAVDYTTAVATPTGFVIAGFAGRPVAWSSIDGEAWTAESVPGSQTRDVTDAAAWGDRVLLVGALNLDPDWGACGHPDVANSWIREPSGTWTEAPFQQVFCAGGRPLAAVAGGLAVVVGASVGGDVAYAWSSNDGLRWVDHTGVFAEGVPTVVRATPAGFFAFGVSTNGAWATRTTDGARWTDAVRLPGPARTIPLGAGIIGQRIVVIVLADAESRLIGAISSEDGQTWMPEAVDGLTAAVRVEPIDGGLVAMGGDNQGQALWASADGTTWRRVDLPKARRGDSVTDVAVGHGRAIVLGWVEAEGGGIQPGGWMGPVSLLAP